MSGFVFFENERLLIDDVTHCESSFMHCACTLCCVSNTSMLLLLLLFCLFVFSPCGEALIFSLSGVLCWQGDKATLPNVNEF